MGGRAHRDSGGLRRYESICVVGKAAGWGDYFEAGSLHLAGIHRCGDPEHQQVGDGGERVAATQSPGVAAKQVAILDLLSGGRVLLGVGVGWLKNEFEALAVPFNDRGRRHDGYLQAMRAL